MVSADDPFSLGVDVDDDTQPLAEGAETIEGIGDLEVSDEDSKAVTGGADTVKGGVAWTNNDEGPKETVTFVYGH